MTTLKLSANTQNREQIGQTIRADIKAKWDKFSDQDLASLNDKNELVAYLAAKYGLEQLQARVEVDALLKGREFRRRG